MSEWKNTNLGELCSDISYGYTASATSKAIGPKFLRITDIVPVRIDWDTVPYCETDKLTNEKYKLQNGDIVIARTGATTGYNKIIKKISCNAVFASYLIRYKIDENKAYSYYIGHILQSANWSDYVDAIVGGSAQPGANAKQLGSFEVSLPPLPEQKAIASVLSSLDDKIDLLHRQNKTLDAMAETLFRQWFVEEAQDDWEKIPLSFIGEHKKINIRPDKNPTKLYRHYSIPAYDDGKHPVQELGSEIKSNKYRVLANSILISKLNPRFPRVWALSETIDDNSICSTEFQVVLPIKYKFYGLIYCFLKSNQVTDELIGAAGGTSGSHQRVKPEDIFNLTLQIPDAIKLDEFNSKTSEYWKRIANNNNQILTLQKLRDTLLPKLMSGKVRVEYEQERDC